jgi:hypothetical protein
MVIYPLEVSFMAKQKNPKPTIYPERITFLATTEQAARLQAHSKVTGMPEAEVIRRALNAYLPKAARKVKAEPAATIAPF